MHNNLRITRILKSLGELGFENFQAPLVRFFLEETLVRKTLSSVKRSVLDYFLFAVRDKRERRKLVRFAFQHFEPKDKFVWCPRKIQKRFKKKSEKRQNSLVGSGEATVNDEDHLRYKNKDGEVTDEQKHSKPIGDLFDAKKQINSDCVMTVEMHSEGSSEDHEPNVDTSSIDVPLNNGTIDNNGEIVSAEPNSAKSQQEGKLTGITQKTEKEIEVSNSNCGSLACSTTGLIDGHNSQDVMDSVLCPANCQRDVSSSGIKKESTDSPKHNIPAQSETFSQSGCHSGLGVTNAQEKNEMNCSQTQESEKEEPMEIVDMSS